MLFESQPFTLVLNFKSLKIMYLANKNNNRIIDLTKESLLNQVLKSDKIYKNGSRINQNYWVKNYD